MNAWTNVRFWLLIAACVVGFVSAFILVASAHAHDWYPIECCHQMDCAPVIQVEKVQPPLQAGLLSGQQQLPVLWVRTIHGSAIVDSNLKPRDSKDNRMHACIRAGKVVCLFQPPGL